MTLITAEEVRRLLNYDPDTGAFTWASAQTRIRIGDIAGSVHKGHGYRQIKVQGRAYLAHRLAWLYVHGNWPSGHIDHINRLRTDNRLDNLRDVTRSQNMQNQIRNSCGVRWNKRERKWQAYIGINGQHIHLGWHKDYTSAVNARKTAELKYHTHRPV